ncbi:MAG: DMT family transporter [Desulfobacterales bacterium]|nr:DMT family transporter [Desulfobacterales bacterium]
MNHPPRGKAPVKGIIYLIGGIFIFSLQDAIIKHLCGDYPLFEIMFCRSLAAIIPCLVLIHFDVGLGRLKSRRPLLLIGRGLLFFCCYILYYLGIAALPLAENIALFYTGPFFITMLSAALLRERVGLSRWAALAACFTGVLVMVNPSSGMATAAAVLPVLAALTYAFTTLATRKAAGTESASVMSLYVMVVFLILAGLQGLVSRHLDIAVTGPPWIDFLLRPWIMPSLPDLGWMLAQGVIATAGFYGLSQAYRLAEASTVAPFEYSGLFPTILWGFLFWNEIPPLPTLCGILLILASGIYLLRQEAAAGAA